MATAFICIVLLLNKYLKASWEKRFSCFRASQARKMWKCNFLATATTKLESRVDVVVVVVGVVSRQMEAN